MSEESLNLNLNSMPSLNKRVIQIFGLIGVSSFLFLLLFIGPQETLSGVFVELVGVCIEAAFLAGLLGWIEHAHRVQERKEDIVAQDERLAHYRKAVRSVVARNLKQVEIALAPYKITDEERKTMTLVARVYKLKAAADSGDMKLKIPIALSVTTPMLLAMVNGAVEVDPAFLSHLARLYGTLEGMRVVCESKDLGHLPDALSALADQIEQLEAAYPAPAG